MCIALNLTFFFMLQDSAQESVITRDIHRTFPAHDYFKDSDGDGQDSLYKICKVSPRHDVEDLSGHLRTVDYIYGCIWMFLKSLQLRALKHTHEIVILKYVLYLSYARQPVPPSPFFFSSVWQVLAWFCFAFKFGSTVYDWLFSYLLGHQQAPFLHINIYTTQWTLLILSSSFQSGSLCFGAHVGRRFRKKTRRRMYI